MAVYTAPFAAVAVSAASDLWELLAHASSRIRIREIRFGQYSDAGSTEAELLSVRFLRGISGTAITSGSGGSTITPVNVSGHTGRPAAVTVVERNNTTQASGGELIWADAWNVQAPFLYLPAEDDQRFTVEAGFHFVVALTAPADAVTLNGTITFEELGFSI